MKIKGRPPRLEQIFQSYEPPLYFITICTIHRQKIRDLDTAHRAFENYVRRGFFDHVLRNGESYGEKWKYVRENPVRAGLVQRAMIGLIEVNLP